MSFDVDINIDAVGNCSLDSPVTFIENWKDIRVGQHVTVPVDYDGVQISGVVTKISSGKSIELKVPEHSQFFQKMFPPEKAGFIENAKCTFYVLLAAVLGGYTLYGAFLS